MNANNNDDIVISRRAIVNFVYIVIYAIITTIVNKWINEYLKKKVGVETVEEQEERRRILPEDDEEEEDEVEDEVVAIANEAVEKDATLWYTIDDGKGRYKGEWMNGLPNGQGIRHIYKDDSYIYGNFVDGNAEGFCKQTFEQTWEKSQPYYEGNFKRNEYHGKGEYHYGDGNYYKGDWKDSKYHGHGADYSKRLNKTWVGEFCNDEKVEGNYVKGEI